MDGNTCYDIYMMLLIIFTECTGCQLALGEDAYELVDNWYVYWNATLVVGAVEAQDLELQVLSATIDETLINLGISNDNLNAISALMTNISASQSLYGVSVSTLDTRVSRKQHISTVHYCVIGCSSYL